MFHALLSHAFAQAQAILTPQQPASEAAFSSSYTSFMQVQGFSYHAFFGSDVCTPDNWEKSWGVAIGVLLLIYLCIILTRVCDQYLIPALEVTSKKWGLSEDVAGVTLLAFGGSFPELAIHTIATIEGSEIGVGTVIGSACFNVTVGLAVVAFLTPFPVVLQAGPLIRDSVVYILCLSIILIFFNWNARVMWWQAFLMIVLYFVFVIGLIVRYQQKTQTGMFSPEVASPRTERTDIESPRDRIGSVGAGEMKEPTSDGAGSGSPPVDGAEASSNGERRGSISQRKKGSADEHSDGEENSEQAGLLARGNGSSSSGGVYQEHRPHTILTSGAAARTTDGPHVSLHDYSDDPNPGPVARTYYAINRPTDAVYKWCIPNCTSPGRHKYYRRSFAMSLFVVLIVSFTLMCIVQYMGCVSGIDHAVTGLLVLGVAASLPDIISVGVSARRGLGVMAVSGLVGSNVFDILVGLGFPWLLHIAIKGGYVALTSGKVYTGAILAVVSVLVFGLSIVINGMRLQKHVAWLPLIMYTIYIILVVKRVADPPEDAPKSF